MTQTLRRERIQKFAKIIQSSRIWKLANDSISPFETNTLCDDLSELAELLADAAESRGEKKTDETKGKYQLQGIEAAMFGDRPVTEQDLPVWEIREKDAISAFESALGVPANWNWYPAKSTEEPTWRDFRKFLVEKYEADPQAFNRYNTWRNQPYVRGAMSNTDIKRFPGNFPTSWSDFEGTTKPSEPKSQTVTTDKHGIVESW